MNIRSESANYIGARSVTAAIKPDIKQAATYPSCQNNGCLANGMRSYKYSVPKASGRILSFPGSEDDGDSALIIRRLSIICDQSIHLKSRLCEVSVNISNYLSNGCRNYCP